MTLDLATIDALAAAVAERLRPMMPPPGWPESRGCISEAQCAEFLAIGSEFLAELRKSRRIEFLQIGRRIVYSPSNVAAFLERCRRNGDRDGRE